MSDQDTGQPSRAPTIGPQTMVQIPLYQIGLAALVLIGGSYGTTQLAFNNSIVMVRDDVASLRKSIGGVQQSQNDTLNKSESGSKEIVAKIDTVSANIDQINGKFSQYDSKIAAIVGRLEQLSTQSSNIQKLVAPPNQAQSDEMAKVLTGYIKKGGADAKVYVLPGFQKLMNGGK